MFGSKNNYVATIVPTAYIMEDVVLLVVAGNASTIYPIAVNTWAYLSTQRNHGTPVITMTHSATNLGYLIFNANANAISQGWRNSYVSLPLSTDFGTGNFTVEMWAYTTAANPHPDVISINANLGTLNATYARSGSLLAQQETRLGNLRRILGYYSFSGNISIVKFFKNKGLSATEVANHFSLTKSRFGY
jgi:hypothetical protein